MNYIELFGFATGLVCVYLNIRQNIWGWPVAMVSVALYAVVFYDSRLYADMGLQVFFFIQCVYGLYEWTAKGPQKEILRVTYSSRLVTIVSFLSTMLCTGLLYFILTEFTNSDVPVLDAFTTSMSIVAQVLLARKKIENWVYWIVVDIIYVGLYLYKALYLTSVLYFIYVFLATYGFLEWKKSLKNATV